MGTSLPSHCFSPERYAHLEGSTYLRPIPAQSLGPISDTDFRLRLYEVRPDGQSVQLSYSLARARYREGLDRPVLLDGPDLRKYRFDGFSFTAFRLEAGSKLRLVIDAPNSIYIQRNYNAAKPVALQTPDDARISTVSMQLGGLNAAVLTVPIREVQ